MKAGSELTVITEQAPWGEGGPLALGLEPTATLKFSRIAKSSLPECPECKNSFETWIDVAGHMVRNDTDHHDHIEGITGKGEGSFYRSREVKELAKILRDRYGKPDTH